MKDFDIVGFGPEFCPAHIFHPHDGPIRVGADGDCSKFFRCLEHALNNDAGIQALAFFRRRSAKLPGGHFHVVGLQCCDHILNRHLVISQLVGVQPDAHRILAAEFLYFSHPRHPRKNFFQGGLGIVPQVITIHASAFRDQAHNDQVVFRGLAHLHPLVLHHRRQARHGELKFVLHLGPGEIRIGPRGKGQLNAGSPG